LRPLFIVVSVLGAAIVFTWRLRETTRPVTARKILIPPLGMSTGLFMFAYPPTRIPILWATCAFAAGCVLFTYPLVRTSRLTRQGDSILLERSRAFLYILLGLVAVRFAARAWVEAHVTPMQTSSIFFLVAFGMILPWRLLMFAEYRRLTAPARV
jgi:membrane protein CcdC involved in cytochrome C biogenesis